MSAVTGDSTGFADVLADWLDEGIPLDPGRVPGSSIWPEAFAALTSEYDALRTAWVQSQGWLGTPSAHPKTEMLRDELEIWAWITIKGQLLRAAEEYLSAEGAA
ncbi:hypothetical protein [Mycolicibacterium fallax]|nr:hypothetical protein [Mycolicibacterium fallax]MCB0929849.1 hypothetical protein [Mycobacterium sp.]